MEKRYDILAVGGINIDLVMTVSHLPSHDEKVTAQFLGRFPGGPAGNFACAAGRYGARVAALCTVGDDLSGHLVIEDFERFGVDTAHIQVRPGYETPFTVIEVDPTGERAIIVPHFNDHIEPQDIIELLPLTRGVYTMPHQVDSFSTFAAAARHARVEVMIDIEPTLGFSRPDLLQILSVTGIASFNQPGFEAATGEILSLEAARHLLECGPHTIVVTRGAGGSLAVTRSEAVEVPGFKVPVLDTTGAGDTFNAGFLTATLAGLPLRQRLLFANAGAALAIGCLGSRACLPGRTEVVDFLSRRAIQIRW